VVRYNLDSFDGCGVVDELKKLGNQGVVEEAICFLRHPDVNIWMVLPQLIYHELAITLRSIGIKICGIGNRNETIRREGHLIAM
jgi:hypothetical protein